MLRLLALLLSVSPALAQGSAIDPIPISSLPFLVEEPGAYYVTKDLICPSGASGILIQSDEVDIDLNGRTIRGAPGSQDAILAVSTSEGVVVRNGFLSNLGRNGVEAKLVQRGHFEGLTIRDCGESGLISGTDCTIVRCKSTGNGGDGIFGGVHSLVRDVYVSQNKGSGLRVQLGSRIESCMAIEGFSHGIVAASQSVVTNCSSISNAVVGIQAGGGTLIENGFVHKNGGTAIEITGTCTVRACKVDFPGGGVTPQVGILATSNENVIEGNSVTHGACGVRLLGIRNYVVGNVLSANDVGIDFLPGNQVGPIVTTASSSNPRANLVY